MKRVMKLSERAMMRNEIDELAVKGIYVCMNGDVELMKKNTISPSGVDLDVSAYLGLGPNPVFSQDPQTYEQVPNQIEWRTTMQKEIETLEKKSNLGDSPLPKVLLVYVDGILVEGNSEEMILDVKQYLDNLFTIKDLGIAKYFLGLEIAKSPQVIAVTQTKYITYILQDMGHSQAKTVTTPYLQALNFQQELKMFCLILKLTED
ncbi:UNVERIFIED_CONTAM: hypothetical protein Scaly_1804300 [Sesamum calycinum]|uniref:Reverse transcriptase Ty1/copia-type domain-containing protein n=1 Tax=Sesamum calycinum TaxID=2727403 RepID=A0AAW2NX94_9LAMI